MTGASELLTDKKRRLTDKKIQPRSLSAQLTLNYEILMLIPGPLMDNRR